MKDPQKRTCCDISLIHQDGFLDLGRNGDPSFFIRNRKMPLKDFLFIMIDRRGITLSLELRNHMKTVHPGMEISKPGYLKQRMELDPLAFYELYHHHNRNFYAFYLSWIPDPCRRRLRDQYPHYRGDSERIRDIQQKRDKSRIRHYMGTDIGQRMEELGYIALWMLKVPLPEEREYPNMHKRAYRSAK